MNFFVDEVHLRTSHKYFFFLSIMSDEIFDFQYSLGIKLMISFSFPVDLARVCLFFYSNSLLVSKNSLHVLLSISRSD